MTLEKAVLKEIKPKAKKLKLKLKELKQECKGSQDYSNSKDEV